MRKRILFGIISIITVLTFCIMLNNCVVDDDPTDVTPFIEGTIIVEDSGDWTNLKIGIFYASDTDTDPNYDWYFYPYFYEGTSATSIEYRAIYWNNSDDSMVELTPENTSSDISDNSGTSSDYWIELPETASATGVYYALVWMDADDDGNLDLIDSASDATQIASSEFSRCPVKNMDGSDHAIVSFYDDGDGGYKFTGQPGNYLTDFDTSGDDGFDFTMIPDVNGW